MHIFPIETPHAPQAIGPYAQALRVQSLLFVSGQLPVDPATGNLCSGTIEAQTEMCLKNLEAILKAAGTSLQNVLKTTVFLKNLNDFSAMNSVYERMFQGHKPARSTVEVSRLPRDAHIEIEAIAYIPE